MSSSRCQARHDPIDGRVARKLPVAASLLVGRKIAKKATFSVDFYHRSRQGAEDDKTDNPILRFVSRAHICAASGAIAPTFSWSFAKSPLGNDGLLVRWGAEPPRVGQ